MSENLQHPKIKIVQYMFGDFEYFQWSEKINSIYSNRHGYEHVIARDEPRRDRHITWHKIPVILRELHDCDYLLWMDADSFFYSHELKINQELIPLMENSSILLPVDVFCESIRWHDDLPCSGVMFMKNCDMVHEFIKTWNNASEWDLESRWTWPPEQLALWRVVLPVYQAHIKILKDYYLMNGNYGQFIRHYPRMKDSERKEAMKKFCDQRGIS